MATDRAAPDLCAPAAMCASAQIDNRTSSAEGPAASLLTPVQFLRGVGPQRAELLERLGLRTARDVLFNFPRDYQDLTDLRPISQLEDGALVSVVGTVTELDQRNTSNGGAMLGVLIQQDGRGLRGLWFNQPYMRDKFTVGRRVLFSGKVRLRGLMWEMSHPRVETLADDEDPPAGRLLPVYPLCEGLSQGQMRRIAQFALETCADLLEEVFPDAYLAAHDLWPLRQALPQIHFPDHAAALAQARRRFIYQELFVMQLALAARRRRQLAGAAAPSLPASTAIDARIRRLFPFELTAGQNQAIAEVASDMARPIPMNRLLQGDVGSGKTVVAVYSLLLAVAHGAQAVLMAPTEILARQHAQTLSGLLAASRVRYAMLTGGATPAERRETLDRLVRGELDLLIGTHALLGPEVRFNRLGLVVIDEQHKFGVRHRAQLKQAGANPHYLVMTATPIPRTVAMTAFGDLDVSTLRDAPPGRQQVHTYLAAPDQRARWWEFVRRKLGEGRQAYVIVPLVEDTEHVSAASLEETYRELAAGELAAFRVGHVHGGMASAEKDAQLQAFREGRTQVLCATSVVEVGIDVPNATLMAIEGGERFGLAQLHQLRGRVSRGTHPGFCCVFADAQTDDARDRLQAFVGTTDGFSLAEADFALRGPGDLFGSKQHGLPQLRIANLQRDTAVLEEARRDAQAMIAQDPDLADPRHERLRRMTLTRYGRVLELGDVG
jgi:ATP-dependent DNA helicase RecG